jgi:hypothetical protein
MAVVTITSSGGRAMTSSVACTSSVSSASGMIRSVGACSTVAPRRVKADTSSSERRSEVRTTANPVNCSGFSLGVGVDVDVDAGVDAGVDGDVDVDVGVGFVGNAELIGGTSSQVSDQDSDVTGTPSVTRGPV